MANFGAFYPLNTTARFSFLQKTGPLYTYKYTDNY